MNAFKRPVLFAITMLVTALLLPVASHAQKAPQQETIQPPPLQQFLQSKMKPTEFKTLSGERRKAEAAARAAERAAEENEDIPQQGIPEQNVSEHILYRHFLL